MKEPLEIFLRSVRVLALLYEYPFQALFARYYSLFAGACDDVLFSVLCGKKQ